MPSIPNLYIIVLVDEDGEIVKYWDGSRFSSKPYRAHKFISYNAAVDETEVQMMDMRVRVVKWFPLKNQTTPSQAT